METQKIANLLMFLIMNLPNLQQENGTLLMTKMDNMAMGMKMVQLFSLK